MNYKMFACYLCFILIMITGCSMYNYIIYTDDIQQGTYLDDKTMSKIHIGMTKTEVSNILGKPIIEPIFNEDTWYYIYSLKLKHKHTTHKKIIINFNQAGVVSHITKS
ncbi:MAG: outer membrane protein assembly factor BamE [Pantoea sp. Brub]|nr:outer membrane protein assembly factor BamE [Pantoea sp. Brub]